MNPSVRASVTVHRATYTLGGGDGRVRPVEIAVVRRQVWRTTRATRIDAGAATGLAAHQVAVGLSADVLQEEVDHGDLGTFDLAVDAERDAFLAAVAGIGRSSGRLPVYEANDATGRGTATLSGFEV